ncbi:MAG TPA: hypothetical protein VEL76_13495 [Gemmataceae bacterium]|nr:hypothetical protein [Gemmataceae bacterium]
MSADAGRLVVVKVGGSLFDLPDLGPRLRTWLATRGGDALLVPGGGATADVVRALDRTHGLGEEAAHWLALRALTLNAHFLQALLPEATIVGQPHERPTPASTPAILDAFRFACADEGRPGQLPHCWAVTSDALAARVAVVAKARQLVLLKSVALPEGMTWTEAGRCGFVDEWFARVLEQARIDLTVKWVNVRG